MRPATVLLAAVKIAVLFARCDDPFATRCGWPGLKATALKASALADRLQPVATATNRCPSTSDLRKTDVDAWNQPFLISCEQGNPIMVVVTSVGRDGARGTADDIKRSAETAVYCPAPTERLHDAEGKHDPAAAAPGDAPGDEAPLAQQDPATREASIKYLENSLPKFGWHLASGPRDAELAAFVKSILDRNHRPLPDNFRFAISKQKGTWRVTVLDLDAFLRGDRVRASSTVYRIGYRHGRLELLRMEVG